MDPDREDITDTINKQKNGFEHFAIKVASILSLPIVTKLAQVFDYSTEEIDKYGHAKDPSSDFLHSLKEKHIINFSDISRILEALNAIDLREVSDDVMRLFEQSKEYVENEARKTILINALKKTYSEFFNDIQPIPFKDRLLHVNEVFLDSGIEVLHMKGVHESWERLESHHCILNAPHKASTRFLLYGEHGFGKSTLAQQLAYDWRNKCEKSPLRDVEIFIFLRLSRVNYSFSVSVSIKQALLFREAKLNEKDVAKVLRDAKSVVLVLQGFDRYVQKVKKSKNTKHDNKDDENKTDCQDDDITKIIKGEMFPNFRVIVTTTPSCIPKEMPPSTIKVRLTGFDSNAQDKYFNETLGTTKELMKIKSEIKGNPMMCELCQIPFFFGIVMNLISEGNVPFSFTTVTKFFGYMIGSFHEQMKNKLTYEDRRKMEKLNANHRKLDKLSFEALTAANKKERWIKKEIRKLIGGALYDQYVAVGILVEEEAVTIDVSPNVPTSTLVQRKTHTKFYHSIFLQWFAANYIADQAKMFNVESKLQKLSTSDSKYVFQFACGINPISSSKIINYLQNHDNKSDLVNLCLLEQEECHKNS